MTNATFFNWTNEQFTGYWNGKPKTFAPGERLYMPAWLAEHFAKHLTNRELIKAGKETATSPKFPAQVPEFMEVFNRAFIPDGKGESGELDSIIAGAAVEEPSMNIAVKQPASMNESSPAAAQAAQRAADAAPVAEAPEAAGVPTTEGGATVLEGPADDDDDYQPPTPTVAPAAPASGVGLA